ncbi:hypothetical protein [Chishuiella sp.]|uniref:hypothetical protein n=1 Tax=Chishuiella sp. TaxID=1969467 RepID=UPI0028AB0F91|nr:hypothetical protein [Chishuiella sp.]
MNTCLQCHQPLFGRKDKKFCNDLCRNTYNNNLNRDKVEIVRNINNKLRKNNRILKNILEVGSRSVTKNYLNLNNFDFKYITNVNESKHGTVFYVYDVGYQKLDDENYLLFQE